MAAAAARAAASSAAAYKAEKERKLRSLNRADRSSADQAELVEMRAVVDAMLGAEEDERAEAAAMESKRQREILAAEAETRRQRGFLRRHTCLNRYDRFAAWLRKAVTTATWFEISIAAVIVVVGKL